VTATFPNFPVYLYIRNRTISGVGTNSVVGEPEGSTQLITKSAIGHDPELVPPHILMLHLPKTHFSRFTPILFSVLQVDVSPLKLCVHSLRLPILPKPPRCL